MSKGKVTDFFATRKRNRFNQDDVLLNKQKKTQTLIDPMDVISMEKSKLIKAVESELKSRSTRARTRQSMKESGEQPAPEITQPIENEPVKKVTRASARKQKLEELKQKMNRLDDKLEKVKEVAPKPAEIEAKSSEPASKPAPVKQKGKKKVNMAELKAKIQNFNDNLQAVQEKIEISKAEVTKPVDEPPIAAAFDKFKDLASSDIDIKCTLTLPVSYSRILDAFKGSDSIVKFLTNRQETCTFLKLKLGIQNITKHNFTLKHLGQIKTTFPLAYRYKQEKMFIDFKNDYHLTIHPNLDDVKELNDKGLKDFSPSVLLSRLNLFKSNLFMMVKNLHQTFLESIGITNVDFKDIKRWHPKFDLESCPEIETSELPKSPNESIKAKTGQDLLNIAKDVYSSRIQEAIKDHNQETSNKQKLDDLEIVNGPKLLNNIPEKKVASTDKGNDENTVPSTPKSADDQKLSQLKDKKEKTYNALLEKIRNKEKTKAFESMVINSDKEKKTVRYGLYKDTIRFLLFFFQSEKKSTIEMEKIMIKLAENLKGKISEIEARELLTEMIADSNLHGENGTKWITTIKVRNINYIKMDKSFQLNDLWAKCDKLIVSLK